MTNPSPSDEDTSVPQLLPPSPTRSPLFSSPSSPPPPLDLTGPEGPEEAPQWSPSPDDVPPIDLGAGTGSGSPSTEPETTGKGKLSACRRMAREAVETAGVVANKLLTRPESAKREVALYVPDPEDVKAIGNPLGQLVARRVPDGATAVANPDLADLAALAAGLVKYALKQRERFVMADYADNGARGEVVDHGGDADAFPPTEGEA